MSTNEVTYYVDTTARAARAAQVPNASFTNGMNNAAACAPGIGVTTGSYDPKTSDWKRVVASAALQSQQIGETKRNLFVIDALGADCTTAFVSKGTPTADGAVIVTIATKDYLNRTGAILPANSFTFGVADA